MKNRIYLFLLLGLMISLLKGCKEEEVEPGVSANTDTLVGVETSSIVYSSSNQHTRSINYPPSDFFSSEGVDEYLGKIITYLKEVNDSTQFAVSFLENHGHPLWQYAQPLEYDGKMVYSVPVKNEQEVTAIWFFEMNSVYTKYKLFTRPEEGDSLSELDWMFDYFNIRLSCYTPKQEGEVVQFVVLQTRGVFFVEYCYDVYTGYRDSSGTEHLEYRYAHCWYEYVFVHESFGNGGNPDGGNPGGGGGGTLPVSLKEKMAGLFESTSKLNEKELEKLEKAIDEMLENCYAEAIYNYLKSKGVKFSDVSIDEKLRGQASLSLGSDKLTFQGLDDISFGSLYHEMFHLFQESEGSYTGSNVVGMMEYERTLFEDIAFTVQHMKKGKIPREAYNERKSPWLYADKGIEEQKKYEKWLKKTTKKGKKYPISISDADFKR